MDKCSGFEEDGKNIISNIVDNGCFIGRGEFFLGLGRFFSIGRGIFFKKACNCAMGSYISGLLLCRTRLRACLGPTVIATWSVQASGRARSARLPSGLRDNLDTDYLLRQRRMFAALRRWIEIEITRWCNGNTRVFGTRIPGSNPGRVVCQIVDCRFEIVD